VVFADISLMFTEHLLLLLEEKYGPRHDDTLNTQRFVGQSLYLLGRHEESLEHRQKALDGYMSLYGEDHHNTLQAMSDVAVSLKHTHRAKEASVILEKVLVKRRALGGDRHPETLIVMNNLGT
jgi:hypothetical protein